jgi:GNAT superfamily N-acetyltransferase
MLELYDLERRRGTEVGMRREELPGLIRHVDQVGRFSTIIATDLAESDAAQAIEEQIAYFDGMGHDFEWKVFSHDRPGDMVERLRVRGFTIDESEAILGLDITSAPDQVFKPTPSVRRVTEAAEAPERIRYEMAHAPDQISLYVAEVDGRAVSHGWVRFPPGRPFASLWGGATEPAYRRRGLYSQLVSARVEEARERGYHYVSVDAGRLSRPILERRGFLQLEQTWATACTHFAPR